MTKNMQEVWKDIAGFDGYQVSNLGNVKSIKFGNERILKAGNVNGYQQVQLCRAGKKKNMLVHRLVACAFIPNPDNLPFINHLDEDKTNNNVTNLEWCTCEYNINYGSHNERSSKKRSKPVRCIENGVIFPSTMEVERQLGFSKGSISQCCNGNLKTAYGFHWEWA